MPEHTEVIVTPGIAGEEPGLVTNTANIILTMSHTITLRTCWQWINPSDARCLLLLCDVIWSMWPSQWDTISYWPRAHNLLQHITQLPISREQAWQLLSSLTSDDHSWPLIGLWREYWPLIGQCLMMMVWPYWGVMMSRLWLSWVIDRDKHDTILRLMDKQKWTHSVTNWVWNEEALYYLDKISLIWQKWQRHNP